MRLFIKNMVSLRCKMVVKTELEKLGLNATVIELVIKVAEDKILKLTA